MTATRRLLILGAATLVGAVQAQARPAAASRPPAQPHDLPDLLAIGRGALAARRGED
jgi:hypothetical protein